MFNDDVFVPKGKTSHSWIQAVNSEDYLSRVIEQTQIYLAQAKQHVGHATNATESILYEYNRLVSLQDVADVEMVAKKATRKHTIAHHMRHQSCQKGGPECTPTILTRRCCF